MSEQIAVTETLLRIQKEGLQAALATVISVKGSVPRHVGSKMIIWPDGAIVGTVGGGQMESRVIQDGIQAIHTGESTIVEYTLNDIGAGDPGICGGTIQLFIEPIVTAPTLLVIGGGHVGKALAELGKWAGFRVILSDDRPEFCNDTYVAGLDGYLVVPPGEVASHIIIDANTYIAAVTRGLPVDEKLIPSLLETPAAYIGLIGSRRRWALTVKALEEKGISRESLDRVHAPLGLELNAETPQEIAVSILAEIIMIYRGGDGKPMKWMGKIEDAVSNDS
ncbi:MAG: XdhC family protein [Anaerolineae bacterium]|nr:XdhC family protein [Anaerolineae bacterium]